MNKRKYKPICPVCKKRMKRLYDRSGAGGKNGFKTFPSYGCRGTDESPHTEIRKSKNAP